ncbi:MAG: hypothetical protein ABIR39_08500 [Nocardioides sp.]|uniref:hypothetical protein n=1 Tax=Nocardioides sp. TaxID=35761 RepID=UPI0032667B1D
MLDALTLDQAVDLTRTGDLWLFRGRTAADRAIQTLTNSPVNHVGMAVVIDDLPPLMWHAELSKVLTDVWTGGNHRGVQLHDLREAVDRWSGTYGQQAWLRQLTPEVGRAQEDALLTAIARLDGVSFPSMSRLAARWFRARDAYVAVKKRGVKVRPEQAFCAEVVATTLQDMGIISLDRRATWFDPGTFWSGDYLPLRDGWGYGREVKVGKPGPGRVPSARDRWR